MIDREVPVDRQARRADLVARRWNRIAVGIAAVTGLAALLLPLGSSSSVDSNGTQTSSSVSLLSNEGPSVLLIVAIPIVLVALPLLLRGRASYRARVVIVVLLTILVLLGMMSIGLFFIPTLAAMIASMSAQSRAYDPSAAVAAL